MKRFTVQISIILSGMILLISCLDSPEISDIPTIKFKKLEFVDVLEGADSLKLTFDFEDGNGDIGLQVGETYSPFQPFFYIIYYDSAKADYENVTISDTLAVPPFYAVDEDGFGFLFSETDNRSMFNCSDYYFESNLADTFFVFRNEYHSNMYLKFFRKENGSYSETSIAEYFNISDCNAVVENLRIPIFDYEKFGNPTVGNITYTYLSNGIGLFLASDTFKLQFYIYDRQLNKSNVVDSPDFLLSDVEK
ncbi:MAG: hypothetical protein ACJA08_002248 [Cyclobacteriaceae bacterium]|jgi:hypothetical protein